MVVEPYNCHDRQLSSAGQSESHDKGKHLPCSQKCGRPQLCGHICSESCHGGSNCPPCTRPCAAKCMHSRCKALCTDLCAPCAEPCTWYCPHQVCFASVCNLSLSVTTQYCLHHAPEIVLLNVCRASARPHAQTCAPPVLSHAPGIAHIRYALQVYAVCQSYLQGDTVCTLHPPVCCQVCAQPVQGHMHRLVRPMC